MPKITRRTTNLQTRLSPLDEERFFALAKAQNRTGTELLRESIKFYLDHCDRQVVDYQESKLERRLKRLEDRMAGLLARLGMDIGIVYNFLWHQSDPETRRQLFDKCYKDARLRLANKLDVLEEDFVDLVKAKVLAEEKAPKPTE